MRQEGIKDQTVFNKRIGVQRALTRWKDPKDCWPGLKAFLGINNAFGRSLDWIIWGQGEPLKISEAATSYISLPVPPIDENLHRLVLFEVEDYLQSHKESLLTSDKNSLITDLYVHCLESKDRPSSFLVHKYFLLCKKL